MFHGRWFSRAHRGRFNKGLADGAQLRSEQEVPKFVLVGAMVINTIVPIGQTKETALIRKRRRIKR